MPDPVPVVALEGLSKRYPGVTALDGVSLQLLPGEVHALIGENGAGKSTLIKALAGALRPDAGRILVRGQLVSLASPADARRHGIATIFQELAIQPWLSVTANVVLGNEPTRGVGGQLLSAGRAHAVARDALGRLGATEPRPRALAGHLPTAHKQLVEIARALAVGAPVIVMDEPTASLPGRDAEQLLRVVRQLRDGGAAILFVSHRLEEVRAVADRVTVLRGGRHVVTEEAASLPVGRMIELMVGRPIEELFPPRNTAVGEVVFRATGLSRAGAFADVSFEVRAGEVLGFAGLIGAGRTEVMRAIFGADRLDAGELEIAGRPLRPRRPRDAIAAGIAYLPEDRKDHGLILTMSGRENMVIPTLRRFSPRGLVRHRAVRRRTDELASRLGVRGRLDGPARTLSGGNQQKLVLAKWMLSGARLLVFDEPTRGIDIGAKLEVYRAIHNLAADGAAIVLVSSELAEVMNVAHRIVVMSGGRVQDRLDLPDFDEQRILTAAFAAHTAVRSETRLETRPEVER